MGKVLSQRLQGKPAAMGREEVNSRLPLVVRGTVSRPAAECQQRLPRLLPALPIPPRARGDPRLPECRSPRQPGGLRLFELADDVESFHGFDLPCLTILGGAAALEPGDRFACW